MSTQIDFYLLPNNDLDKLACRLAEKAFKNEYEIFIKTESEQQLKALDQKLWDFKAESFLPHAVDEQAPIRLSCDDPETATDMLINLSPIVPENFSQFKRVCEIVPNTPEKLQLAREHYKHYQQQGCKVNHHKLG